jgi:hypothetical protein
VPIVDTEPTLAPKAGTALAKQTQAVAIDATGSATDLLRIAVERGTPVAELKELVALHDQMQARQARQEYAAAMARFQVECPPIHHERTAEIVTKSGSKYKYSYAELDVIARTVNPILARHGLSYRWDTKLERDTLTVICTVMHAAGHSETSTFTLPTESASAMSAQQKVGAALTFAQRRSLCSALGLTTTDDDPDTQREDPTPIDDDQVTMIDDLIAETGTDKARFLRYMNCETVGTIPAARYAEAMTALEQKRSRK